MSRRGPIAVIVVAAVLTALAAWRVTTLRPETSLAGLLDPHDPSAEAMGRVIADFPLAEEMLVLASLPPGDDDAARLTDFAARLSDSLQAQPSLVRATRWRAGDSARAFVQDVMAPAGLLYLNGDQLAAAEARLRPAEMRAQLDRSAAMLAAPGPAAGGLAKVIVQDPLRLHEFFVAAMQSAGLPPSAGGGGDAFLTTDGRGILIRIEGAQPPGDLDFSKRLTDSVTTAAEQSNPQGLHLQFSGAYAIAAHNAAVIRGDAIGSSVVSTVALAVLFALIYRKPVRSFLLAAGPVAMGLVWGFGIYACFKSTVTPLAAVIGGVLGGVGIDYPVHLMAHRRENETPLGTTRRMFAPLLIAWLTSTVGFAAVAWSPLRVLRDFALIGSLGLAGAWIATMTLVPALLTLAGDRAAGVTNTRGEFARRLWPIVMWRPRLLARCGFVVVGVTLVAALFASHGIAEETDLTALHPRPNPPLDALNDIDRRMGSGSGSFVVLIQADDDAGLLRRAWQVRTRLGNADNVRGVFGPASLLPDPEVARQRMTREVNTARVVSDFRAAVADSSFDAHAFDAYAAFLPTLLKPAVSPTIADLRRYPDLAQTMLPSTAGRIEATAAIFPKSEPKTPADVAVFIDDVRAKLRGIDGVSLTGMAVLGSDTRHAVSRDAPRVAITALVAVTFFLLWHLRSLPLALLTILPTMFSFACVLIAMRLLGFGLNAVNLVMFPLLLGVTVDYGIFATDVLRPGSKDTATERFLAATTALLACVMTTLIGFGSLVTVAVPAVRSLGWLINIGLAACLAAAVFILWPTVVGIATKRGRL